MKIIQINCFYQNGSTGKIVADIGEYLKNNHIESIICYGRGEKNTEQRVYKISGEVEARIHSIQSKLFGVEFSHSPIATKRLINLIKRENPDVVHLHCLNGHFVNVYKLLNYLKGEKIKTILTLHAEIMHTAGCEHAMECEKWKQECNCCSAVGGKISHYFRDDAIHCFRMMKAAMDGFDTLTVVGVSDWITYRAKQSGIFSDFKGRFATVKNGLNTNIFYPREQNDIRQKLGLDKKNIILHVTPNFRHPIKGGKYVLEIAKKHPEWNVIIVGFNGDYENLPSNVLAINKTRSQDELAKYYSLADITLLTSKRETFSMVCAESLCCGTPVVGFMAGGPETISIREYSKFVPYGELERLEAAIIEMINKKLIVDKKTPHIIYSRERMAEEYFNLYKD